jgi:hypothetical protein
MADYPPPPSKAVLDAETDQALAAIREALAAEQCPEPGLHDVLVGGHADMLRAQFGDVPHLGRILFAAAQSLKAMAEQLSATGAGPVGWELVLAIGALGGEQLDREAAGRG